MPALTVPASNREVDWADPLNRGLIGWWIIHQNPGGTAFPDIAGHTFATHSDPTNATEHWNTGNDQTPGGVYSVRFSQNVTPDYLDVGDYSGRF